MKKNILWAIILSPFFSIAQSQGISFTSGLNWQEVVQKAKSENKFVFVDCYATWCGPCKMMDKMIYTDDSVGIFMNSNFVCIRLQMDSTRQDDDDIKKWYSTAHSFEEKYHMPAYPFFLYFSPDGQVVHKDMAEKDIKGFIAMSKAAMDPQQQYYTLLADYRKGKIIDSLMSVLINAAGRVGQGSLTEEVAKDYIHNHLNKLPEKELWTKENILLMNRFSSFIDIHDTIFEMYYKSRIIIDTLMHVADFADYLINEILYRDGIRPEIDKALTARTEPNWHQLSMAVSSNYDLKYAEKNVLRGRVEYYKAEKKWKIYIKYFIRQQESEGVEDRRPGKGMPNLDVNNNAYEIFEHASTKRELEKALSWVNLALSDTPDPEFMDTKANILYKLGRKSEALALEKKSHELSPKDNNIASNYKKMTNGVPTWPAE